jgi:polyferredoxin
LFTVQAASDGTRLDIEQPLQLDLTLQRGSADAAASVRRPMQRPFAIPDAARYRPQTEPPAWLAAWSQRWVDLAVLTAGLLVLSVALLRQRWLSARPGRLAAFRTAYLVFTLGFIGWWAQGQLTILTLTSAIEAGVARRALNFLLADPVAVLLWAFTGVALLVWGRGTFCGWLCPFGALQELASRVTSLLGLRPRHLHRAVDRRLKWLKYGALGVLCSGALASAGWTDTAVEVEPFKTAISQVFQREWPFVAWALLCVAAGVLVFRGYCRYLCPLGAALALLGRLRRWRWIPRHDACGTPCQTCRHRCAYQAITPAGQVQYDECFQCLDCVALHQDPRQCLPLLQQARRVIPIEVVR